MSAATMATDSIESTRPVIYVDFRGDRLEVVEDMDGVWVSVRRVCECLGTTLSRQIKRLRSQAWAVVAQKTTTGPDGKKYQTFCIRLDRLTMWLSRIDANRVSAAIRPKLEAYQCECADVLYRHFAEKGRAAALKEAQLPPSPPPSSPRSSIRERIDIEHEIFYRPIRSDDELANGPSTPLTVGELIARLIGGPHATDPERTVSELAFARVANDEAVVGMAISYLQLKQEAGKPVSAEEWRAIKAFHCALQARIQASGKLAELLDSIGTGRFGEAQQFSRRMGTGR